MKKQNNLPTISGANRRAPSVVNNLEALKTSGIAFATYGMRKGDVVEFPDSLDEAQVFQQPVREGSTAVQTLVVVMKNGKPTYLSMGSLRKQDVDRNYTCKFTQEMGELNNDYDRLAALCGKKIKAVDEKRIKSQRFDRLTGERIEGETIDQTVPIIEYE